MKKQPDGTEIISQWETKLSNAKKSSERLEALVNLVSQCFRFRQYARTKSYVVKALFLSKRLDNTRSEAFVNYIAGANYIHLDQNSLALDHLNRALKISQHLDNNKLLSDIIDAIGYIYALIGDHDRALEYFLEAIKYEETNIVSLNNVGYIYAKTKDYHKSLEYLWKGHTISKEKGETEVVLTTLVNIATNYYSLKEYQTSMIHFSEALQTAHEHKFPSHEVFACTGLSKIHNTMGDKQNSQLFMKRACQVTSKITRKSKRLECYANIADAYGDLSDYKKAYKYFNSYLEIRGKLHPEELSQKLSSIHANYEIEKNDMETMRMIEKSSRLATIGIIAEGITQDIGNPLSVIKIYADSILFWDRHNAGYLPSIIVNVVKDIADSSKRIDDIIMHMSQFWVNPEIGSEDTFDLNNAIDSALLMIATRIASHDIELQSNTAKEELPVRGNQIYFEQIVINLIFNSIQVLDKSTKTDKLISVSSYKKDGWAYFDIYDNGPGLAEEVADKIYDPFYTTKNKEENMGLGLAIVKQIVDRFKGTISHKNIEPEGVTFSTGIPLAEVDQ